MTGRATRDGLNLPSADQVRCRQIITIAELGEDPRMAKLENLARALLYPDSGEGVGKGDLVSQLVEIGKAELAAGPLGLEDRATLAKSTRDAELEYLRLMSPGAAEAAERHRAA